MNKPPVHPAQAKTVKSNKFLARLGRSQFFAYSLLIHSLLIVLLGSAVLFQAVMQDEEFVVEPGGGGFITEVAQPQAPPPVPQQTLQTPTVQAISPAVSQQTSLTAITTVGPSVASFSVPAFSTVVPTPTQSLQATTQQAPVVRGLTGMSTTQAQAIKAFTGGWVVPGSGGSGSDPASLKRRKFKFTAYLAKYSGGDWNSTVTLNRDKIVKGSLPNLLYFMKKFSSDRIDANPDPVPLNLASSEIFTVKPPFIFFTGRRDFTLTDAEVENLRKYVMSGGAIWGDSSLPGRRSRFDIAFRREMRRVLPDRDKDFEPLPADHPIYVGGYFPQIRTTPPGLNYYQEPVEVLRIFGEIAVIYTMNDYGDMWQIALDSKGEVDLSRNASLNYVFTDEQIWIRRSTYFRNLSKESLMSAYQFGTNVVVHLLVRWENPLRRVPTGL